MGMTDTLLGSAIPSPRKNGTAAVPLDKNRPAHSSAAFYCTGCPSCGIGKRDCVSPYEEWCFFSNVPVSSCAMRVEVQPEPMQCSVAWSEQDTNTGLCKIERNKKRVTFKGQRCGTHTRIVSTVFATDVDGKEKRKPIPKKCLTPVIEEVLFDAGDTEGTCCQFKREGCIISSPEEQQEKNNGPCGNSSKPNDIDPSIEGPKPWHDKETSKDLQTRKFSYPMNKVILSVSNKHTQTHQSQRLNDFADSEFSTFFASDDPKVTFIPNESPDISQSLQKAEHNGGPETSCRENISGSTLASRMKDWYTSEETNLGESFPHRDAGHDVYVESHLAWAQGTNMIHSRRHSCSIANDPFSDDGDKPDQRENEKSTNETVSKVEGQQNQKEIETESEPNPINDSKKETRGRGIGNNEAAQYEDQCNRKDDEGYASLEAKIENLIIKYGRSTVKKKDEEAKVRSVDSHSTRQERCVVPRFQKSTEMEIPGAAITTNISGHSLTPENKVWKTSLDSSDTGDIRAKVSCHGTPIEVSAAGVQRRNCFRDQCLSPTRLPVGSATEINVQSSRSKQAGMDPINYYDYDNVTMSNNRGYKGDKNADDTRTGRLKDDASSESDGQFMRNSVAMFERSATNDPCTQDKELIWRTRDNEDIHSKEKENGNDEENATQGENMAGCTGHHRRIILNRNKEMGIESRKRGKYVDCVDPCFRGCGCCFISSDSHSCGFHTQNHRGSTVVSAKPLDSTPGEQKPELSIGHRSQSDKGGSVFKSAPENKALNISLASSGTRDSVGTVVGQRTSKMASDVQERNQMHAQIICDGVGNEGQLSSRKRDKLDLKDPVSTDFPYSNNRNKPKNNHRVKLLPLEDKIGFNNSGKCLVKTKSFGKDTMRLKVRGRKSDPEGLNLDVRNREALEQEYNTKISAYVDYPFPKPVGHQKEKECATSRRCFISSDIGSKKGDEILPCESHGKEEQREDETVLEEKIIKCLAKYGMILHEEQGDCCIRCQKCDDSGIRSCDSPCISSVPHFCNLVSAYDSGNFIFSDEFSAVSPGTEKPGQVGDAASGKDIACLQQPNRKMSGEKSMHVTAANDSQSRELSLNLSGISASKEVQTHDIRVANNISTQCPSPILCPLPRARRSKFKYVAQVRNMPMFMSLNGSNKSDNKSEKESTQGSTEDSTGAYYDGMESLANDSLSAQEKSGKSKSIRSGKKTESSGKSKGTAVPSSKLDSRRQKEVSSENKTESSGKEKAADDPSSKSDSRRQNERETSEPEPVEEEAQASDTRDNEALRCDRGKNEGGEEGAALEEKIERCLEKYAKRMQKKEEGKDFESSYMKSEKIVDPCLKGSRAYSQTSPRSCISPRWSPRCPPCPTAGISSRIGVGPSRCPAYCNLRRHHERQSRPKTCTFALATCCPPPEPVTQIPKPASPQTQMKPIIKMDNSTREKPPMNVSPNPSQPPTEPTTKSPEPVSSQPLTEPPTKSPEPVSSQPPTEPTAKSPEPVSPQPQPQPQPDPQDPPAPTMDTCCKTPDIFCHCKDISYFSCGKCSSSSLRRFTPPVLESSIQYPRTQLCCEISPWSCCCSYRPSEQPSICHRLSNKICCDVSSWSPCGGTMYRGSYCCPNRPMTTEMSVLRRWRREKERSFDTSCCQGSMPHCSRHGICRR